MNRLARLCPVFLPLALVSCGAAQAVPEATLGSAGELASLEAHTMEDFRVVPMPQRLVPGAGLFVVSGATTVNSMDEAPDVRAVATYLAARLGITDSPSHPGRSSIQLRIDESMSGDEAYRLAVDPDEVLIEAKAASGLFYGVQTLMQLQAPGPGDKPQFKSVQIEDAPRFGYRGMHLDVSRHFFTVEEVKRFIDLMARFKYNTFHWHLTDDQGWRIEIKKYPKLTEVGGVRNETLVGHDRERPHRFDGKPYGGFYTQTEIREVVAYASARFVTVVPEIELPGHALAALSAHPELGCDSTDSTKYEAATKWGIFEDVFCPTERTFSLLEDVLSEVIGMFPGKYVHIGGDEVPKTVWKVSAEAQAVMVREALKDEEELQSYFVRRIEKFLNSQGRQLIGWDEILEGGLSPGATVMSWRGVEGGIQAASEGHDVIMAPNTHVYFNTYQSSDFESEKPAGARFLPLEKTYSFEPVPDVLNTEQAKSIIGGEGCLWSEYIPNEEHLQYMMFPRAIALAEVLWSEKQARSWDDFSRRLPAQLERLKSDGVSFGTQFFDVRPTVQGSANGTMSIALEAPGAGAIHYTLDGTTPNADSPQYQPGKSIVLERKSTLRAASFQGQEALGRASPHEFFPHAALGLKGDFGVPFDDKYASAGVTALTDGLRGSTTFGDGRWLGFWDKNLDVSYALTGSASRLVSSIEVSFLSHPAAWILYPAEVSVFVTHQGKETLAQKIPIPQLSGFEQPELKTVKVDVNARVSAIRVFAKTGGPLPEWHEGAGKPAWLFVDEIIVHSAEH